MKKLYSLLIMMVLSVTGLAQSGSLDPSFGADGIVVGTFKNKPSEVTATTVQADGKILIAGNAGNPSFRQMAVARFYPDGFSG